MTKTHTIPFHIGDFLGETMGMSTEAVGAFMLLILAHYQAGENGLKDDDKILSRLARLSIKKWVLLKPEVMSQFDLTQSFWTHLSVKKVLQKVSKNSEINRAKILKRWKSDDTVVIPKTEKKPENKNTDVIQSNIQYPISIKKEKINKKEKENLGDKNPSVKLESRTAIPNTTKPKPPDDKPDNPWWWSGHVIRLRKRDYQAWYAMVEEGFGWEDERFMAWLDNRDEWLNDHPEFSQNWFISTKNAIQKMLKEPA